MRWPHLFTGEDTEVQGCSVPPSHGEASLLGSGLRACRSPGSREVGEAGRMSQLGPHLLLASVVLASFRF